MDHKASRLIWQTDSWRLQAVTITLPNGRQAEKGVIDHPGSVVLIPIVNDSNPVEIWMIRQYRLALDETILELPAGTRGWHEGWLDCAQRELREEIGMRAESFTPMGEIWPAPGSSNEKMQLMLATGLSADPLPPDLDEQIERVAMPLDDLVAMALNGRLHDAKSVVAILRAAHLLSQQLG